MIGVPRALLQVVAMVDQVAKQDVDPIHLEGLVAMVRHPPCRVLQSLPGQYNSCGQSTGQSAIVDALIACSTFIRLPVGPVGLVRESRVCC